MTIDPTTAKNKARITKMIELCGNLEVALRIVEAYATRNNQPALEAAAREAWERRDCDPDAPPMKGSWMDKVDQ